MWLFLILLALAPSSGGAFPLPPDGGQLNILDFGAIPNDGKDDTAAIQAALDAMQVLSIVYLPNGVYDISDTLYFYNVATGARRTHITLMGESTTGAIVRLKNSTSGFTNPSVPKPMLKSAEGNTVFGQWLQDLTVNTGAGNCGAVGVDWISNNRGGLDRVAIVSGDSTKCGVLGIDLRRQWPGPMTLKNVSVSGFDKALETLHDEYGIAIENLTITNQRVVGLDIHAHTMAIRGLTSRNQVTAVRIRHPNATVSLVGATMKGGSLSQPAIDLQDGVAYLRAISQQGYGWILNHQGSLMPGATLTEWISQPAVVGFADPAHGALKLSYPGMPSIPYPDPSLWVNAVSYGASPAQSGDDAPGIQAAIDAAAGQGKTTIYLPFGFYNITTTLVFHGSVQRLIGLHARLLLDGALATAGGPFFRVTTPASRVSFEHLSLDRVSGSAPYTVINHDINSWVVFQHGSTTAGRATYRSTGGGAKLRLIDYNMQLDIRGNAQAWAIGWNIEGDAPTADHAHAKVSDGATFWVHLFKSEGDSVAIHAKNGAKVELFGHLHKWGNGTPNIVANFVSEDSQMSLAAVRYLDPTLVRENRNGMIYDVVPGLPQQQALYVGW